MKYEKVRCLTRVETTDDTKPCYRWRAHNQFICDYSLEVREHRVPSFLTLHAHLIIEEILTVIAMKFQPQLFSKITDLFYDIIRGLVSGHNMKEISSFWRQR
jgi:hypothetical protein